MKYVNEYTIGGTAVAALTAASAYYFKATMLTVPGVAQLALASTVVVGLSYGTFLAAKAAYNYFFAAEATTENKDAKKDDAKKQPTRQSRRLRGLEPENTVENKVEAKVEAKPVTTRVADGVKAAGEGVKSRFNAAVDYVKGIFKGSEASVAPAATEKAKPAAKIEAAKPAAKIEAAKPAAKPAITPAMQNAKKAAAKKAAAKKPAAKPVAAPEGRPVRERKAPARYGFN